MLTTRGQASSGGTGAWTGANNSNDVYKIDPVPAAAHHQDLIVALPLDPPELLTAREAILAVLRR